MSLNSRRLRPLSLMQNPWLVIGLHCLFALGLGVFLCVYLLHGIESAEAPSEERTTTVCDCRY